MTHMQKTRSECLKRPCGVWSAARSSPRPRCRPGDQPRVGEHIAISTAPPCPIRNVPTQPTISHRPRAQAPRSSRHLRAHQAHTSLSERQSAPSVDRSRLGV